MMACGRVNTVFQGSMDGNLHPISGFVSPFKIEASLLTLKCLLGLHHPRNHSLLQSWVKTYCSVGPALGPNSKRQFDRHSS